MPQPPEPVKPTPFDVAPAPVESSAQPASTRPGQQLPWLPLSLALLVALALAVFLWLPEQIQENPAFIAPVTEPPAATIPDNASGPDGAAIKEADTAAEETAAPWEEALQTKLRRETQAILEPLLDLQLTLKEQGVQIWAPQEYAAALAQAQDGDALYKQRQFEAASARYQAALEAMQALDASRPQRLQALLNEVRQALEALDQTTASTSLQTAQALDPGNTELTGLSARVARMPQMLDLFSAAAAAESNGDLTSALHELDQAKTLDPEHQHAASEWQRINTALENQQYQQAMSRGYSALASDDLATARTAFQRALALRPEAPRVREALRQVEDADTGSRLASLSQKGQRQERNEQWQDALDTYRQALTLDSTVLFAAEGLTRAAPRAALDKQLGDLIDNPGRLAEPAVARAVAAKLETAKAATPHGPRLQQQIEQLQTQLQLANTPVPVTLRSDEQTEVVLYKVARLGKFAQHPLDLRPGTYTAAGSRNGYRDVRVVFTVQPGTTAAPVTIACTEPIQ